MINQRHLMQSPVKVTSLNANTPTTASVMQDEKIASELFANQRLEDGIIIPESESDMMQNAQKLIDDLINDFKGSSVGAHKMHRDLNRKLGKAEITLNVYRMVKENLTAQGFYPSLIKDDAFINSSGVMVSESLKEMLVKADAYISSLSRNGLDTLTRAQFEKRIKELDAQYDKGTITGNYYDWVSRYLKHLNIIKFTPVRNLFKNSDESNLFHHNLKEIRAWYDEYADSISLYDLLGYSLFHLAKNSVDINAKEYYATQVIMHASYENNAEIKIMLKTITEQKEGLKNPLELSHHQRVLAKEIDAVVDYALHQSNTLSPTIAEAFKEGNRKLLNGDPNASDQLQKAFNLLPKDNFYHQIISARSMVKMSNLYQPLFQAMDELAIAFQGAKYEKNEIYLNTLMLLYHQVSKSIKAAHDMYVADLILFDQRNVLEKISELKPPFSLPMTYIYRTRYLLDHFAITKTDEAELKFISAYMDFHKAKAQFEKFYQMDLYEKWVTQFSNDLYRMNLKDTQETIIMEITTYFRQIRQEAEKISQENEGSKQKAEQGTKPLRDYGQTSNHFAYFTGMAIVAASTIGYFKRHAIVNYFSNREQLSTPIREPDNKRKKSKVRVNEVDKLTTRLQTRPEVILTNFLEFERRLQQFEIDMQQYQSTLKDHELIENLEIESSKIKENTTELDSAQFNCDTAIKRFKGFQKRFKRIHEHLAGSKQACISLRQRVEQQASTSNDSMKHLEDELAILKANTVSAIDADIKVLEEDFLMYQSAKEHLDDYTSASQKKFAKVNTDNHNKNEDKKQSADDTKKEIVVNPTYDAKPYFFNNAINDKKTVNVIDISGLSNTLLPASARNVDAFKVLIKVTINDIAEIHKNNLQDDPNRIQGKLNERAWLYLLFVLFNAVRKHCHEEKLNNFFNDMRNILMHRHLHENENLHSDYVTEIVSIISPFCRQEQIDLDNLKLAVERTKLFKMAKKEGPALTVEIFVQSIEQSIADLKELLSNNDYEHSASKLAAIRHCIMTIGERVQQFRKGGPKKDKSLITCYKNMTTKIYENDKALFAILDDCADARYLISHQAHNLSQPTMPFINSISVQVRQMNTNLQNYVELNKTVRPKGQKTF